MRNEKPVLLDLGYDPDGNQGVLLCPYCEGIDSCLHHQGVSYFAREEDDAFGTRVSVNEWSPDGMPHHTSNVSVNVDMRNQLEGNPSARRGGIVILFWCELCGGNYELCFAQHKGQTLTFWAGTEE